MTILDVLRGKYVAGSPSLRRLAGPVLSVVPFRFRYGRTYWNYRRWIQRSESDPEFVERWQNANVAEILRLARDRSVHYRRILPSSGELGVAELRSLPVLTKDEVREAPDLFRVLPKDRTDTVSTSGSSGRPVHFFLSRDRGAKEKAFIHHIWSRIGFALKHKRAVLRGVYLENVDRVPFEYDAALRELRLSPFHLTEGWMDRFLELIYGHRIHFLHGYPSAISILASHVLQRDWKPPESMIGILPISESLLPHQRELIASAFNGCEIMPFYGMTEKVAIAGEIKGEADIYEFEPLYGITELLDGMGDRVLTPGTKGRIVGTGFISRGMALLRYDTGDEAELVQVGARENGYRLRVRNIRSRWAQESLLGAQGEQISVSAINIHSPVYARIREFCFKQREEGKVDVLVVPRREGSQQELEPFVTELQTKVGQSLRFRLVVVSELPKNMRGKRKFVIQDEDALG